MINRVSNNYTNPYTENRKKVSESQEAPAFLLNYDEKGVVWEHGSDKDKEEENVKSEASNKRSDKRNSRDTYESSIKIEKAITEEKESSVIDSLRKVLASISDRAKKTFKAIFEFIWYGNDERPNEVKHVDATENVGNAESLEGANETEISEGEKAKLKYVNSFDQEYYKKLEQARKGVSGVPARNTNLLTTYNKRGQIKNISASESDRVLHGDKSIKL